MSLARSAAKGLVAFAPAVLIGGVASAAVISSSQLDFKTDFTGSVSDSQVWTAGGADIRVCGDVLNVPASNAVSGTMTINRDIDFWPDPRVVDSSLPYSTDGIKCSGWTGSVGGNYYYTKMYVTKSTQTYRGFIEARKRS